jgi:hypothetical protein
MPMLTTEAIYSIANVFQQRLEATWTNVNPHLNSGLGRCLHRTR